MKKPKEAIERMRGRMIDYAEGRTVLAYLDSLPDDATTILRALDLLDAVDESSDGLVRELDEVGAPGGRNYATAQKARARIVALERELASVKAERDSLKLALLKLGVTEVQSIVERTP